MSPPQPASDRAFGLFFAGVFGIFALFMENGAQDGLAVAAGVFLLLALTFPVTLSWLNRLWTRFGVLLGRFMEPVIMGMLFFGVFLPVGWLMRLFGGGVKQGWDAKAKTYWIPRQPPGPGSMSFPF